MRGTERRSDGKAARSGKWSISAADGIASFLQVERAGLAARQCPAQQYGRSWWSRWPDWQTEGYGVPFEWGQYELMATKLRQIKGKAIISLNDHPDIRRCFEGFGMESLAIDYTVGGVATGPSARN